MPPTTESILCRACGSPIPYSGTGRPPTACSERCRRDVRAADARTRRASDRPTTPAAPPITTELRASLDRWRESRAERHAQYANRYEELREAIASPADFQPSDLPADAKRADRIPLAELGVSNVRRKRDGTTEWESDPSPRQRAATDRAEAKAIRQACRADAERECRRRTNAELLTPDESATLRDQLLAAADERADGLIAALDLSATS